MIYFIRNQLGSPTQGMKVDPTLCSGVLDKYKEQYDNACKALYNYGVNDSNTELNVLMVKKAMKEISPKLFRYLLDKNGVNSFSQELCRYALYKAKTVVDEDAETVKEFVAILNAFSTALYAKETCGVIAYLRSVAGMQKKKPIRPNFSTSMWMRDTAKTNCNVGAVMEVLHREPNTEVIAVDTMFMVRDYLLKQYVGVSEEEIARHDSEKAFFVEGLTVEEELDILHLIVNLSVECDTAIGRKYKQQRMKETDWELSNTDKVSVDDCFDNKVFQQTIKERSAYVYEVSKKYSKCRPFFLDSRYAYIEVPREANTEEKTAGYAIDYETGESFPLFNAVNGCFGEYISAVAVAEGNYYVDGKPVKIGKIADDNTSVMYEDYYPITAVHIGNPNTTPCLQSKWGSKVTKYEVSDFMKQYGVASHNALFDSIAMTIPMDFNIPVQYRQLYINYVADLICACIYKVLCQRDYVFDSAYYDSMPEQCVELAYITCENIFGRKWALK